MKITKAELKRIIKEELEAALDEFQDPGAHVQAPPGSPLHKMRCKAIETEYRKAWDAMADGNTTAHWNLDSAEKKYAAAKCGKLSETKELYSKE